MCQSRHSMIVQGLMTLALCEEMRVRKERLWTVTVAADGDIENSHSNVDSTSQYEYRRSAHVRAGGRVDIANSAHVSLPKKPASSETLELNSSMKSSHHSEDAGKFICKEVVQGHTLPMFQFIGCQKCGSSTVYNMLKQHPQVKPASKKELLFWKENCFPFKDKTCREDAAIGFLAGNDAAGILSRYANQFPRLPCQNERSDCVTGEFTATHLECVRCPHVFRAMWANAGGWPAGRVIAQLREPFSRAQSRYKEQISLGYDFLLGSKKDWQNNIQPRLSDLKACKAKATDLVAEAQCASGDNILGWSLYSTFLKNWASVGFDSSNLLVTYLDNLHDKPLETFHRMEDFLGLRHFNAYEHAADVYNGEGGYNWNIVQSQKKVEAKHENTPSKIAFVGLHEDSDFNAELRAFFREEVLALDKLCEANGWKRPPRAWLEALSSDGHHNLTAMFQRDESLTMQDT